MKQHPVPQNVMSVEFQLIGNMTLKQFGYLAAGAILAFIFYSTPLPSFLKWPLTLSFFGLGAAFAFAPINDIPLDRWLTNFIHAIYAPTKRIWKKEPKSLEFLLPDFSRFLASVLPSQPPLVKDRSKLEDYLSTLKPEPVLTPLDSLEQASLNRLDFGLQTPLPAAPAVLMPPTVVAPPPPSVEGPRVVETPEVAKENIEQIASVVSFKPVLTVRLPDKSIFVKPVSNVRVRSLHPLPVLEGTILLPVRGEKVFRVSSELKARLSEKVHPINISLEPLHDLSSGKIFPVKSEASILTPKPLQEEKSLPPKVVTISKSVSETKTTPYKTVPYEEVERELEISKIKGQIASGLAHTIRRFKSVALENKRLNEELTRLKQAHSQSPSLVSKSELDRVISDYKQQVERLRTEREALFAQLSSLQGQAKRFQEQSATSSSLEQELADLRAKMTILAQEKLKAQEHAEVLKQSLSSLQEQIQSQFKELEVESSEESLARAAAAVKPQIRVVAAKTAMGKMAPTITSIPNVINGVVKDKDGLLIPDVVIVVRDPDDEPVRALKTNKVGQFAISTPLPNGTYLIELEKEGYKFDIIEVKLKGEILAPIEIQSN